MPTDKGWLLIIFSFGNERLVIFVQVPTKELWELLFKIKVWNQHGRSLFWYQTGFSIIVVFSTASSKFLGGMAIPKSWVWPMVWLHASGFDLTMIRKFWCGNSSPQFFRFDQKGPGHSTDEGCVLFIHGFGEDGLQNQIWPTVKNRCHVLMFKSHVACVWWQFTGWWMAGSAPQT